MSRALENKEFLNSALYKSVALLYHEWQDDGRAASFSSISQRQGGAALGVIRDNVKQNLGYYLSLRGITQKELAERLGVSQAAVTNWVKGKNSPDIDVLADICEFLNITVSNLLGIDESVKTK